ncbi:MAG: sulfatase family protein [Opitutales bacterium]
MEAKIKKTCIALAAALSVLHASAIQKPNIIVIYADDVGYGDIGCYGATAIDTPNIDALAKRGIRFTAGYATSSTCTPSRYSLLTGDYPFRNERAGQKEVLPGNAPLIIDTARPTLPSMLKSVGYSTALVGKWHLGLGSYSEPLDWNGPIQPGPAEVGFDYSFHMAATGDRVPSVYIENGRIVGLDPNDPVEVSYQAPIGSEPTGLSHPQRLRIQSDEQHSGTIVNGVGRIGWMSGGNSARWDDEMMGDTFLGKALEFIGNCQDQPFFLFYATHENHVPRLPHPRFRGSSGLGVRGDVVVQLDWCVGKLVETLKQNGQLDNTLIVFSSDNGPAIFDGYYDGAPEKNGDHRAAGPWRGDKYSAWEGGCRVPFIVSWPGAIEPGRSAAIVSQVDLLASFASLTGAELPNDFRSDSQNLIDLLTGRSHEGRDHVVLQGVGIKAIRSGDWKYVPPGTVLSKGGIDEKILETIGEAGALYFLPEDPEELNNLAGVYPAKAMELKKLLEAELDATTVD